MKILVPVDFSKTSDNACLFAIEFAKKIKGSLILMHSFESTMLYTKIPMTSMQVDQTTMYNEALTKLKVFYEKIKKISGSLKVELSVQQGLASARIIELAIEKKVELIVMGATGKGSVERVFIGSDASRTMRDSPCMVLVVPHKAKFDGMKKIVFATDLTEDNLAHGNLLSSIAEMLNSELLFLNVGKDVLKKDEDSIDVTIAKVKSRIKYPNISVHIINDDDIVKGLDHFLNVNQVDALSIYTHHRNFFSRLFGSSVAHEISLHTSVPLLVIHEDDYVKELSKKEKE